MVMNASWMSACLSKRVRNRRDRIDQRNQLRHVVAIGPGEDGGKRYTARINNDVVFRPVFPAVHGTWSRFFPPCTARTDDESTITRDKSICSSAGSWFNTRRCSWF